MWPELDPEQDAGTWRVLHLASQMLGKLRVARADWVNHGWHVALQPAANSLAMLPIASPAGRFLLSLDLCTTASTCSSTMAGTTRLLWRSQPLRSCMPS